MTRFRPFQPVDSLAENNQTLLEALAGLMIPPSERYQTPGADDPTIFADIVETAKRRGEELVHALEVIRTSTPISDNFLELGSDEQLSIIRELQTRSPDVLGPIVAVVCQCYYRDDRVMRSLGMPTHAPFPTGYQIPQGDWSLLDPVRERSDKVWRDA